MASAETWLPGVRFENRYDDNLFFRPRPLSGYVAVVTPELRIQQQTPLTSWEVLGSHSWISYSGASSPVSLSNRAQLSVRHAASEFDSLGVDGRYVRSIDPVGFDQRVLLTHGRTTGVSVVPWVNWYRAEAGYSLNSWLYSDPTFDDGLAQSWKVNLMPVRDPTTAWLLGYREQELTLRKRAVLSSHRLLTGVRRQHTRTWSSELLIGEVITNYHDRTPTEHRLASSLAIKGVSQASGFPASIYGRLGRDVITNGEGRLAWSWPNGSFSVGAERLLDAEGGVFKRANVTTRGVVAAEDTLGGFHVFGVEGSYGRSRAFRSLGPRIDVYRASVYYGVPLLPWLSARAGYDYAREKTPSGSGILDFDRNRFSLSFEAGLQ